MPQSMKDWTLCGMVLTLIICMTGCGEKVEAPPAKTEAQIQAELAAAELHKKRVAEDAATLAADLAKVTPKMIRAMISDCKSLIGYRAKSDNGNSPFAYSMVDEYSADVHQAAAHLGGGKTSGDEQMIKDFLKARKAGDSNLESQLNMSYSVIFTTDSFSGPKKTTKSYHCWINPGLRVSLL